MSEDELLAEEAFNDSEFVGEVSYYRYVGDTIHNPCDTIDKFTFDSSSGPDVIVGQRRVPNQPLAQEDWSFDQALLGLNNNIGTNLNDASIVVPLSKLNKPKVILMVYRSKTEGKRKK